MKTIQLGLQIADDIISIDQLEQSVGYMGQQIKCQLFTNMLIRVQVTAANASDSQTVDEFLPALFSASILSKGYGLIIIMVAKLVDSSGISFKSN